jgi:hypothetical protein
VVTGSRSGFDAFSVEQSRWREVWPPRPGEEVGCEVVEGAEASCGWLQVRLELDVRDFRDRWNRYGRGWDGCCPPKWGVCREAMNVPAVERRMKRGRVGWYTEYARKHRRAFDARR